MGSIHSIEDVLDRMRKDLDKAQAAAAKSRQQADEDAATAADLRRTFEGFERYVHNLNREQLTIAMPIGGAGIPEAANGIPTGREARIAMILAEGTRRRDWSADDLLAEFRRRRWDDPTLKDELGAMRATLYRMRGHNKIAKGGKAASFRRLPSKGEASTGEATPVEGTAEHREERVN